MKAAVSRRGGHQRTTAHPKGDANFIGIRKAVADTSGPTFAGGVSQPSRRRAREPPAPTRRNGTWAGTEPVTHDSYLRRL